MIKSILIFSFFSFINSALFAQEVIATSGDYSENANASLSWTIGETMTETYTAGTTILTQGFQQSKLTATSVFELPESNITVGIAPNPATNFVKLKISDTENISFRLFDYNGKLINKTKVISEETEIPFSRLPNAAYFLKIMKGNMLIKTFQIIKQ